MLNQNVKKWVEALRSGEFEQCFGTLRSWTQPRGGIKQVKYCALGVAYVVAARNGVELGPDDFTAYCGLTTELQKWYGAKDDSVTLNKISVLSLNDFAEMTFPEIADAIESHPDAFGEV